ncbi:hypothetical protein WISP_00959 [Willisornis vidua]|uniref:Uncharacterized protein n=1 Tax=Willisornis vidua TaxID=1566151 RepID=A0ABQ9DVL0_9PASS|nr:hypothetical protein WISP_00959 [Willisornis vidua]
MASSTLCQTCIVTCSILMVRTVEEFLVQPEHSVWVTLANAMGQDTICLFTATPADPSQMCLVGIPTDADKFVIRQQTADMGLALEWATHTSSGHSVLEWKLNATKPAPAILVQKVATVAVSTPKKQDFEPS